MPTFEESIACAILADTIMRIISAPETDKDLYERILALLVESKTRQLTAGERQ